MSQVKESLFLLENSLDQASIICILDFLSIREINNLASLLNSSSIEIKEQLYNQPTLRNLKFGNCLLIYCWHDKFWKNLIIEKIERINTKLLEPSIVIELPNECNGNYRLEFINYIWKNIRSDNWKIIQEKRRERKEYIRSLSHKLSEIGKLNVGYKTEECEELLRKRINEGYFIEESSLLGTLKENFKTNKFPYIYEKWVSIGMSVGKTSLIMKLGGLDISEYVPTVFDSLSSTPFITLINNKGEETKLNYCVGFWDTVGKREFDELRPLSYPETSIFTMNYAINDWSSLQQLAEHLIWECIKSEPSATFVVVSTKNDLEEACYWNSLLFPHVMEQPISSQDGIEFTKEIGAISFIETSSKTMKGIIGMDQKLVQIRKMHLEYLKSLTKKNCSVW